MVPRTTDRPTSLLTTLPACLVACLAVACASTPSPDNPAASPAATSAPNAALQQRSFETPEAAFDALILAAEQFDVAALKEILGPDGVELVVTADPVLDRNQSAAFAAQARVKKQVVRGEPELQGVAFLTVGDDDWPMPIPAVENGGVWRFDPGMAREEILNRRIGANELDAIEVCRGFVEAQHEYAMTKHDNAPVNQYAQRIVSTPGKQDGLAWRDPDGSWQGPVGEGIARAIAEGYSDRTDPYHGYYFKVLKGQGASAPLGEMEFVVKGFMIGGFALVAAPAEYEVTGVKTFIVSHDGVVFEKDLGPTTLEQFRAMERFDPDLTWTPVEEE
jgi:hypothetical protein